MAEDSRFFTSSTGDTRSYSSANFAEVLNRVLTTGYFDGVANELAVTASSPADMNVNVATGEAFIQGYYYKNTASKVLAVTAADGSNPRIDRVVLELDLVTNRLINLKMLDGTPAASPVAPALTQSGTTYQITLAQVYVAAGATSLATGTITDERDTVTAPVSGANQAKANSLYSGSIYHLTGSDTGNTTSRYTGCTPGIVSDGTYIYLIGGGDGTGANALKTVEKFTPDFASASAGSWAAMTDITTARVYFQPVYYDGNIYAIGGSEDTNPINYSTKNECYSISGNSWSTLTAMTTGRDYCTAVVVGAYIYVIGGTTTGPAGSAKNERYSVAGNSWATMADTPVTNVATGHNIMSCTDGTNIYFCINDGAVKFYRYNVAGDSYNLLTAPGAMCTWLCYYDGYIYGMSNNSKVLRRYNITLGTWNDSVVTDVGWTQNTGGTTITVLHGYRFFGCTYYTTTASVWFTTHYPLVTSMTARALCGFQTNNDPTYYKLKNVTTDLISPANGVVGCAVGDKLALAIESKSATATATITVYG